MEVCGDGLTEELEHRAALLSTGGDRGPDALTPSSAPFAPRPLGDESIDDHEAHGLLGQIVRRLDPRRGDEPEVCFSMKSKPVRHVLGFGSLWGAFAYLDQLVTGSLHRTLELLGRHALPAVDHPKQLPQLGQ